MRKYLIPIVAAASALAVASPASAQWRAPAYNYAPYNYGHGFEGHRFAREMDNRVQRLRRDISEMQRNRVLSWQEDRSLQIQAMNLEKRIYWASRNGIQPNEARRLFGARMVERGAGGHIVNLASAAAYLPAKDLAAYATSKAAVLMASDCLRAELAGTGIAVSEFGRQPDVQQPQPGDRLQLEQIPGHRREQVRQ